MINFLFIFYNKCYSVNVYSKRNMNSAFCCCLGPKYLFIMRWHRWKVISPTILFLSLFVSFFFSVMLMLCAQTAEDINTISFAYDSHMSLKLH